MKIFRNKYEEKNIYNKPEKKMEEKIFLEKDKMPDENELKSVLGKRYGLWSGILKSIETNHGAIVSEWKYYNKNSGWVQKIYLKKRNLLFFTPYKNFFSVGMVFGDKAVGEIIKSNLPAEIIKEITAAKKYAEGRGINIEIKNKESAETIKKLLQIKISN